MSKEIIEEIRDAARPLEEQLKFYREIGVADIGGSAGVAELAPGAVSAVTSEREAQQTVAAPVEEEAAPAQIQLPVEESMPKKKEQGQQAGLFGDILIDEVAKTASNR